MNNNHRLEKDLYNELFLQKKENESLKVLFENDFAQSSRAKKDLIASEIQYRRLFESAKDGILILDAESGMIVDVNPFLIQLLGFSKDCFLKKAIWEIGFFKDIIANQEKFFELQKNEYVRYDDLPLETANGKKINVEFVSNVYKVNNVSVIQCNIRDITDRKKVEKKLHENEVQYSNLANSGMALIWTAGTDKLCQYFNQPWHNFTGRTIEQEKGNGWTEGVHPDDIEKCFKTFIDAFDKREKFEMEYRLLHNSGEYKWIRDLGTPNYNGEGAFVGYIGYCFDITEQKELENELINAKERAEESNKLKTAFLENMSHEIRTPLNGIIGFSTLLNSEDITKQEINDYTSVIIQSGKRLIEIVNNIIDISKIQTGQVKIEKKSIFLNSLFSDLLTFFSPFANTKNTSLSYNNQEEKYQTLFTDEAKLNQIFTNLINNAIKFTNSGKIDFGYEIKDSIIQFYVKDTGSGIEEAQYDRIFDRFTQADLSLTRGYEGAGLGLAICKGLVELLGGKIWVESEVKKGTTFFFTLPYITATIPKKIENEYLETNIRKGKGKILIVEDDWISAKYLSKLFCNTDIFVILAENGEQAVDLVKNTPDIDLVFMDVRMPIMDGLEATKQIKLIRPNLPIIAQTAYALSEERNKILSIGCDDYLSKPIERKKILELLDKYLK